MSIKAELARFKEQKENLQKRLAYVTSSLDNMYAQRDDLSKEVEEFESRKSSLAQQLAEDCKAELSELDANISCTQKEQSDLQQSLNEVEEKIIEREQHTTLYIQEQVDQMIPKVLNYIKNHWKEIGRSIKKSFYIKDREESVYTAVIGIYDENICITQTQNYYFHKLLSSQVSKNHSQETSWYITYLCDFRNAFYQKLKESWPYEETFNLTFEGTTFTLELV